MNTIRSTSSRPTTVSPDGFPDVSLTLPTLTFGRERELQELIGLLDRDDVRLVSLLGPGGVGKTRLAHELMRSLVPEFAHGAVFVPLDAIRDPTHVPGAVALALGLHEGADQPAADIVAAFLGSQHMLLILDNMEQVIGAASLWLSGLLRRAPRLSVVVTSRIPLNIDAEHQYLVPPLAIDGADRAAAPAVRLFAERAQAVRHEFTLDDQDIDVVAEICRRLDGLPLAIELAAARIKILSPEALLARLTDRLTVLTGGHRDAPLRLQSMRDAIGWSYDLLTPEERTLFQRLSVFLGGFTLDAAEFVARWPDTAATDDAAIDRLHSLVDQSLVQPPPPDAGGRYRMLETIREFGISIADAKVADDAFAAHADYILDLARRAERELIGHDQGSWLDLLETEYANIRSAVSWLERNGRIDDAIAILADVIGFMDIRGHTLEAMHHLEGWLRLPELQERSRSRGLLLYAIGVLLHNTGDFYRGVDVLTESMAILMDAGDRYSAAIAGAYLGVMLGFVNDIDRMRLVLEESIEIARETGHHRALSLSLNMMSNGGWGAFTDTEALSFAHKAYRVASEHGDWWMVAFALMGPMIDAFAKGNVADAEKYIRESMRLRTMIGSKRDLPADWMFLSWAAYLQGNAIGAEEYVGSALRIAEETGHGWYKALVSFEWSVLAITQGKLQRSRSLLLTSLDSFPTSRRLDFLSDYLAATAMTAHLAGDAAIAARFMGSSETLHRPYANQDDVPREPGYRLLVPDWRRQLATESTLSETVFRSEWNVGASWTPEEAFTQARTYILHVPDRDQAAPQREVAPAGLSPREVDVLLHMANGLSNQQIADALYVSHRTVTTHVTNIMTKLDAASRTAAVAWAIRNGVA